MPTEPFQLLIEKAASQGMTVFFLIVAVYYIAKVFVKAMEGRVADLKERITATESAIHECNEDRQRLHIELANLAARLK